jgi:hypothetical protein
MCVGLQLFSARQTPSSLSFNNEEELAGRLNLNICDARKLLVLLQAYEYTSDIGSNS